MSTLPSGKVNKFIFYALDNVQSQPCYLAGSHMHSAHHVTRFVLLWYVFVMITSNEDTTHERD